MNLFSRWDSEEATDYSVTRQRGNYTEKIELDNSLIVKVFEKPKGAFRISRLTSSKAHGLIGWQSEEVYIKTRNSDMFKLWNYWERTEMERNPASVLDTGIYTRHYSALTGSLSQSKANRNARSMYRAGSWWNPISTVAPRPTYLTEAAEKIFSKLKEKPKIVTRNG